MTVLRQLYNDRSLDCDEALPFATKAVNCAYTKNIGYTPYFLCKHRDPTTPIYEFARPKTTAKKAQVHVEQK